MTNKEYLPKIIYILIYLYAMFALSIKILGPLIYFLLTIIGIIIFFKKKDLLNNLSFKTVSLLTLFYFFTVILSMLINYNDINWHHIFRKIQFLLAPFIALTFLYIKVDLKKILKFIKIGLIIIGIIVTIQYIFDIQYKSFGHRYSGMFNPNVFGDLVSILTLFSISNIIYENRKEQLLSVFAFLLGVISIFLSGSRGALISFFIVFFIYTIIILVIHKKYKKQILAGIITLFLITFFIFSNNLYIQNRFKTISKRIELWQQNKDKTSAVAARLQMYTAGIKAFKYNPIFGYGYRNATKVAASYIKDKKSKKQISGYSHLHNEIITTLVNMGLIGLFALLVLFLYPLNIFIKHLKNKTYYLPSIMGIILISSYFFLGITHGMLEWENENSFFLFFLIIFLIKVLSAKKQTI
jgi:O-antigen ligase